MQVAQHSQACIESHPAGRVHGMLRSCWGREAHKALYSALCTAANPSR